MNFVYMKYKLFDRVPREVVEKLGVDEWLIRTVMTVYTEAFTVVRTYAGLCKVKVLK